MNLKSPTRQILSLFAFASLAIGTVFGQSTDTSLLDPKQPYLAKKANPVTYRVDFSAVVTPPYHADVLKVWLPLPQSDFGQEVTEGELSTFPMQVKPVVGVEKVFGNKFAYFEFAHPEGAQIIRHTFSIKVWELRWNLDPTKVVKVDRWPESFAPYLRSERQAVVVDERIGKVTQELANPSRNSADQLRAVFSWVNEKMKYSHAKASLAASSIHAMTNSEGHCSDYHSLCAAMGRSLGFPTRMTYGINPFPKNSPSHCRMEAFLPPYGWVSFDVSETQLMMNHLRENKDLSPELREKLVAACQRRLLQGFRENTWFLQTRGSDYDLEPPAKNKVAVVRTIYAEADGVALPEPDPADKNRREFSWMTVHQYTPDRVVPNPFRDWKTLLQE